MTLNKNQAKKWTAIDVPRFIHIVQLLRCKHWVKNSFIFAPLIFSLKFEHLEAIGLSLMTFLYFCFGASSVYVFNDIIDLEKDKMHPIKSKSRPLASDALSIKQALCLLIFCYIGAGLSYFLNPFLFSIIFEYILINIAYSYYLKNKPIIDIFTIATGFVLRVWAGATAINVPLSEWMFVTTLCLALYLAAIKRSKELILHGEENRKVLQYYTTKVTHRFAEISATGSLIFYSLFVMSTNSKLVLSIPFVLFGLFRYWFIIETSQKGESPTQALLSDIGLQVTVCLWAISCMAILKYY